MPTFSVDWDGTCVEGKYPEQGDWLPGAVEALRTLDRLGDVIIFSVRIAPVQPIGTYNEIPKPGEEIPLDPSKVAEEFAYIRNMLDDVGLEHVEIWNRPYKPPAAAYIDDKAVRFEGDWQATVDATLEAIQPTYAR